MLYKTAIKQKQKMMDSQEKRYETLAQIVERVKELADSGVTPEKDEM